MINKEKPKSAVEVLKASRALLNRRGGWTKGTMYDGGIGKDGRYKAYCAVGALRAIDGPAEAKARRILAAVIRSEESGKPIVVKKTSDKSMDEWRIIGYNDHTAYQKNHIIKMFDKAIEIAEKTL